MNSVFLIRHGATAGNLERRYVGRTDQPLCPAGIAQLAQSPARKLAPDLIYTSPLLRARQSAALLFPHQKAEVLPDLAETDFGLWEGHTAEELKDDPAYCAWVDGFCRGPIPDGESIDRFKHRCRRGFLSRMRSLPTGYCAAFVLHGGVIMAILEGFALPARGFYDYHIPNGGCLSCCWENGLLRGVRLL